MFTPGTIVVLDTEKDGWKDGEGLFLGLSDDGYAKILWYVNQGFTLHWSLDKLITKKEQVISEKISPDFRSFIEHLKYMIQVGKVKG
jgi:hypothetical protein